ncbi:MAG: DUF4912 domain-containing protein [Treponema sp.]|jgi:hypothetical protein|nr:DUF4912 domain-containing protein [Treponema sp.]
MMIPHMDHLPLARPYLDSLTTQDLARLADKCGIDIPAGLDRIFIIEELLDYERTEEEEQETEESFSESPDYLETAPIPRQYNITFIDVMVRDPLWAFVFWEVKEHDRENFEKNPDFSGYFLRVSPAGNFRGDLSFTVQVDSGDTARYLGFSEYPPEGIREGAFQVELCVGFGESWEALALSRSFRLPRLQKKVILEQDLPPSLPLLSGLNEFPILRNADRMSHLRFSAGAY